MVNYSNGGTEIAYNAYIDVVLPPEVTPVAVASWGPYWNQAPYNTVQPDSQNGNTYTYQLGDLSPSTSGSFYILIDISCSAVMGETLCAEARIYPNDGCEPIDSIWDKSSVSVEGRCTSDSLACFTIYNTGDFGNGDMDAPSEYRIYDNNVLVVVVGTFQILGGDSTEICYAAAGNTIRLEADQRPGHPGNSHPNDVIELCGSPNQTTGLVTSMPLDDDSPAIDIVCVPVTSSWDPNDKQVTPSGITEEYHFIDSLVTLDYTIRFQNTGTDTAFNVYLIDTISSALDPLTIKSGAASHTYNFTYLATNVVQWYFPWLLLADSNVNEPASHGFINFTIEQRPGNEFGTVIENTAGIYFDFNDPVITNTAFNTVGIPDTFKVLTTSIPVIYNQVAEIKVYPNPFSKSTTFEIAGLDGEQVTIQLFDLTGKRVTSVVGFGKVELDRRELTNGIYFYSVSSETGVLANGKLVIQ
ncbi:MAG: T9SS type A sorting domain-containing protein [Flavobacteriales bacterium]|nr:T9SS type A sorting domain-containing protein [Flavobacteriales bacterium]